MKENPFLPSFLFQKPKSTLIWCFTGGGHCFKENLDLIMKLNNQLIPICLIFSDAGALVANRYGFFWALCHNTLKKDIIHMIFEREAILDYNIGKLISDAGLSFSIIPNDPSYSLAISLANQNEVGCIVGSPFSGNTIAKLAHGISDSFITNLVTHGLKAGKKIGIFPTDASLSTITSFLPVRQITKATSNQIDIITCQFNAIRSKNLSQIEFIASLCVGCRKCVEKYPDIFSYGEEIEVKIRKIDVQNVSKLASEVKIFSNPKEIENFAKKYIRI